MIDIATPDLHSELPSDYASKLGKHYNKIISKTHKKDNGQFFTPVAMARLMASMANVRGCHLRVLDPGCGTGILSCALVESIVNKKTVKSIDLVVYEIDKDLIFFTEASLNYLKQCCWRYCKNAR